MGSTSDIEWTNATWNPVTGCTKTSPGCKNCYAERLAKRLQVMGNPNYANAFELTLHTHMLNLPLRWKKARMIFVNSMSDLFHAKVPLCFIQDTFITMRSASWHTFQVLTKRSERLVELNLELQWPGNVWMGVSVESRDYTFRIDHLRRTNARTKFVSFEPLLGPLPDLNLHDIDWVIVGGESGPGARPLEEKWVVDVRDQCLACGVAFFFKQWGGTYRKSRGRELQGREWVQMPSSLARRELLPA